MEQAELVRKTLVPAKMIVKHPAQSNEQSEDVQETLLAFTLKVKTEKDLNILRRHPNGARAMARHVAEGGTPYDDFGKHIIGLSEELSKLRKFKTYMNRSSVMAEGLAGYLDVVNERIEVQ